MPVFLQSRSLKVHPKKLFNTIFSTVEEKHYELKITVLAEWKRCY